MINSLTTKNETTEDYRIDFQNTFKYLDNYKLGLQIFFNPDNTYIHFVHTLKINQKSDNTMSCIIPIEIPLYLEVYNNKKPYTDLFNEAITFFISPLHFYDYNPTLLAQLHKDADKPLKGDPKYSQVEVEKSLFLAEYPHVIQEYNHIVLSHLGELSNLTNTAEKILFNHLFPHKVIDCVANHEVLSIAKSKKL